MSLELLRQRLTEVSAALVEVHASTHLGQLLGSYAGDGLILEDHPWLRAAASHFPDTSESQTLFIAAPGQSLPEQMATVVTMGLGAVPETGSVLVAGGRSPAWRLSLCPRRHIVVIPLSLSCLSLAAALDLTAREPGGLVSWIAGPSRTADIEKVLVLGAQGAGELVVIVYGEE